MFVLIDFSISTISISFQVNNTMLAKKDE